jgi:hypothetical protein
VRCGQRFAALLAVGIALGACHGRSGDSSAPQSAAGAGTSSEGPAKIIRLVPNGGIGFDDLLFSAELRAVLAPAGGKGCVEVFDSSSLAQASLCGIGPGGVYAGGHGEGTTSADSGAGFVFASDRSSHSLVVVDPKLKRVVASSPLAGGPDYVRWIGGKREVWVTEPDQEQVEIFALASDTPPRLVQTGTIAIKGGPESLVVDAVKGRAFTHLWSGHTVQIDVSSRTVGKSFANGCTGSRGIALDPERGQLFVGCSEGKAVVLDVDHAGKELSSESTPSGVDIVSVNLSLRHLYVPAASDGTITVFGVGKQGKLRKLGALPAAKGTHCVASDDHNRVWACSPESGSLLVFDDPFPAATE